MSLSILFVDDDQYFLRSTERVLHPLKDDWMLSFSDSAASALVTLKILPIDVVVVDMCMPGMSGYELLCRIREEYPDVKRVMMTGKVEYEIYRDGREVSQYFLWKPVRPEALRHLLEQLSDQPVTELPPRCHDYPENLGAC